MVTSLYASIFGVLFFILSVNVIRLRVKYKVGIVDQKEECLERACRTHANFSEYVPFVLLLMLLAELQNTIGATLFHFCGIAFIIGRLSHIYSLLCYEPKTIKKGKISVIFRQIGMVLTFTVLLVLSVNHLYFWSQHFDALY